LRGLQISLTDWNLLQDPNYVALDNYSNYYKMRAQRTHIALCYQAWVAIRVKVASVKKTMYAVVKELYSDYLRAELRQCRIPALSVL